MKNVPWHQFHLLSVPLSQFIFFSWATLVLLSALTLQQDAAQRPVGCSITTTKCSKYRAFLSFWARRPKANYKNQHSLCMRENSQCSSRCRTEELAKLSLSALSLSVFLSLAVSRHPWQMWSRKRSPTSAARWEMQLDHTTRQEATEQRRGKVDLGRLRFNFSNRLLILGLVIVETSRRKINRESLKLTIPFPPSIRPFPHK